MRARSIRRLAGLVGVPMCALMFAPGVAAEVPGTVTHAGRLYDADDNPIDASHALTLRIYTAASSEAPVFTQTFANVHFDAGYYSVEVGPFPAGTFDGSLRYVSVEIDDDGEMSPRLQVTRAPYALE